LIDGLFIPYVNRKGRHLGVRLTG